MPCTAPAVSQTDAGAQTSTWLHLSFEQRTRYEHLTNLFRLNTSGTEKHFFFRTRLRAEVGENSRPVRFLIELQDSHVLYEEAKLYSTRTNINKIDFLQAQLQFQSVGFSSKNVKSRLILGRFTMDMGKRRMVARNNMRNTTNAFDGVSWTLDANGVWNLRTFLTRPVDIDPYSLDLSSRRYFWGAYFELKRFPRLLLDAYYFGLRDVENAKNRQKNTTLGGRFYSKQVPGVLDYEVESAVQFGKNGSEDRTAWLYHGELGFTFNASWQPRFSLHDDYASGDHDPGDGKFNRFDTLYGARGFEYPLTGIYGPIYRSNINTQGIRIQLNPSKNLRFTIVYRAFRLAQAKDAWVGSGLQDKSGNSGKSLGQNLDLRIHWKTGRFITLESGYTHFFKGSYLHLAPDSPASGNSNYFYIATEFKADLLHF